MTLAYTTAKYGMSLVAHGLAEELGKHNVASNCLWPRTSLDTAAVRNVIGAELVKGSRKPSIYADAAYASAYPASAKSSLALFTSLL